MLGPIHDHVVPGSLFWDQVRAEFESVLGLVSGALFGTPSRKSEYHCLGIDPSQEHTSKCMLMAGYAHTHHHGLIKGKLNSGC